MIIFKLTGPRCKRLHIFLSFGRHHHCGTGLTLVVLELAVKQVQCSIRQL